MPSVLVEAGFLSHSSERNFLLSSSGRKKIAEAIFYAFADYKQKIETKSSFNLISQNPPLASSSKEVAISQNSKKTETLINENGMFYSIQILATKNNIDPTSDNFKGEKYIFRKQFDETYKYFIGKHESYAEALNEKSRLQSKYRGCFIVAIENGNLIPLKKARNKR
jgi:N-acetylmuramoyl-L-alanine amidase